MCSSAIFTRANFSFYQIIWGSGWQWGRLSTSQWVDNLTGKQTNDQWSIIERLFAWLENWKHEILLMQSKNIYFSFSATVPRGAIYNKNIEVTFRWRWTAYRSEYFELLVGISNLEINNICKMIDWKRVYLCFVVLVCRHLIKSEWGFFHW